LVLAGLLPYSESSRQILRIFALSLPVQALAVDWVFRAIQRMHYMAIVQVASSLVTLFLTLALVREAGHVLRVPAIAVGVGAMGVALSVQLLCRAGYRLRLSFVFSAFRNHLSQSLPLCAASLAITLYIQLNYLILGNLRGETEVGLYAAAAKVTTVLSTVHWLYYAAMIPAFMQLYAHSRSQARLLLRHSVRVTAVLGFGFMAVGVAGSDLLVGAVFGPAFRGARPVLGVMLASAAVVAVGHNWAQVAIAAHRERLLLNSTLLGGLVNILACALLVRSRGALGAAMGNLLAEIAVHIALFLPWPTEFRGRAMSPALGPAASCALALVLSRVVDPSGGVRAAGLSIVAYGVALFLFGSLTRNDLQTARSALASLIARPAEGVPHV
jgi:O-antigen/teichoic acid export membrane protein